MREDKNKGSAVKQFVWIMANISASFQIFLPATLGTEREKGQILGRGITSWDNTALSFFLFFFANTHLEWCEQPE